jgi:hypothetical protein
MKSFVRAILPMWLYRRLARLYVYLLAWREGPAFLWVMTFGSGENTHQFRALRMPFTFRLTSEDKLVVFGNIIKGEVLEGPLPSGRAVRMRGPSSIWNAMENARFCIKPH